MKSPALERFTLFSKLDIEKEVSHSKGEIWTASQTEGKIFMLDQAFWLHSALPGMESILFYISGNVAFKEGLALKDVIDDSDLYENSEFLLLLWWVKY